MSEFIKLIIKFGHILCEKGNKMSRICMNSKPNALFNIVIRKVN